MGLVTCLTRPHDRQSGLPLTIRRPAPAPARSIHALAGAVKYTAAPAMSSGSPIRPSGHAAASCSSCAGSSHRARANSVRTTAGAIPLTRIPCLPWAAAKLRTSCRSAALVSAYRPSMCEPANATIDETTTIAPPPRAAMRGTAAAHRCMLARMLTAIVLLNASSGVLRNGP